MWFGSLFNSLKPRSARAIARQARPDTARRRPPSRLLRLEFLEDRCLLSNYVVTDLGSFIPDDINNHGLMAGIALDPVQGDHGAVWQNGTTINLGNMGGSGMSVPRKINDAGQVIGYTSVPDATNENGYVVRGFLVTPEDTDQDGTPDRWYRDTNLDGANDLMVTLGLSGGSESYATGINNAGQVVGNTDPGWTYLARAWIWQDGVMSDLGTLGGPSAGAGAINDAGQVVGGSFGDGAFLINPEDTNGDGTPDLWNRDANGDGVNDLMVVLTGMDGGSDINAGGQVVGGKYLWTPESPNGTTGSVTDLNPNDQDGDWMTTGAFGINSSAQVVGNVSITNEEGGDGYSFLWEHGVLVDLSSLIPPGSGWLSVGANAINDQGWIVGEGVRSNGTGAGNLLTPTDQPPPPPPPPSITMSDVTVTEGNTGTRWATFTVTLSTAYDQAVTVAYATADGTAASGSDYQAASSTLTIPAGQTTRAFTVLVNGDRLAEPNETFVVNLSSPTNATIADGQGVGTIVDDEPRISISDVSKSEGRKGKTNLFTFTVTLSAAYDQAVTMSFRTVNGTATTGDNDYVAKTGTLTFAPGETTKTITIEVKGDSKKEANETFYLDLFGNSSNALFTKNRGLGTILNDD